MLPALDRSAPPSIIPSWRPGEVRHNSKDRRGRSPQRLETLDDSALARWAAQGHRRAFEALLQRFTGLIRQLCLSILKDPDDAADAVQATFIRLHERLPSYRGEAPVRVFVSRVAVRIAIDHRRQLLRRGHGGTPAEATSDPRPLPDEATCSRELGRTLTRAFQALPPRYQAILELRELEGRSYAEIATALQVPLGTVMSRLFYARRALRDLLGNVSDEPWGLAPALSPRAA